MILPADLVLERRSGTEQSSADSDRVIMVTPPISPDYWTYRVRVADRQAVVGFPKFSVMGIGFAQEEDWNTNLPSSADPYNIARHIWHNRGPLPDDVPSFDLVVRAIELIQDAVKEDAA